MAVRNCLECQQAQFKHGTEGSARTAVPSTALGTAKSASAQASKPNIFPLTLFFGFFLKKKQKTKQSHSYFVPFIPYITEIESVTSFFFPLFPYSAVAISCFVLCPLHQQQPSVITLAHVLLYYHTRCYFLH